MNSLNGYESRFNKLDSDIDDLKNNLAIAVAHLSEAIKETSGSLCEGQKQSSKVISELSKSIEGLNNHFAIYINVAQNAIPIKAVFWMFLILVITIAGIEGIKVTTKAFGMMP